MNIDPNKLKQFLSKLPKKQFGGGLPWYNQNFNLNSNLQSQVMSPQQDFSVANQDYLRMAHTPAQPQSTNPTFAPGNYNEWDKDNNGIPDTVQKVEGNPSLDPTTNTQKTTTMSQMPTVMSQIHKFCVPKPKFGLFQNRLGANLGIFVVLYGEEQVSFSFNGPGRICKRIKRQK